MARQTTWRDRARPIIAEALRATDGKTEKEIRKALKDAYPWGERAMHPYKIWLDEIKTQRGKKTRADRKNPNPNQTKLF